LCLCMQASHHDLLYFLLFRSAPLIPRVRLSCSIHLLPCPTWASFYYDLPDRSPEVDWMVFFQILSVPCQLLTRGPQDISLACKHDHVDVNFDIDRYNTGRKTVSNSGDQRSSIRIA